MAGTEAAKPSTARRDLLHQIEIDVQKKWDETKAFETCAPEGDSEKFMCTFPYPYMNGLLHIGHAFSLTKAIFAAHFNRLLGKKVLFPFGFHCTGMPIQAAANKLKREFELYGTPYPTFPAGRPAPKENAEGFIELDDAGVTLVWKAPGCTGNKAAKAHKVFMKVGGGGFKEVASVPAPSAEELAGRGGKVSAKIPIETGDCVYKVVVELADGSKCPESNESDVVSIDAAPKDKKSPAGKPGGPRVAKKILAKTGDAAFQWEILKAMDIKPEDMLPFAEPEYWLNYFPPKGVRDLQRFGCPTDFRRSFITTSINPYYDSFIRWQFTKLKASEKIGFGKRPTIFSPLDGQACMDHDRADGEGVGPQEYTAIKIELLEFPKVMEPLKGKKVFLLAATLRAETMPGQTNCWILPEGKYGCFKKSDKEVYVCSHRAARNMSFQELLVPWGKPECLLEVMGKDLMGCKVSAPTSAYKEVHLLPLLTIKMDKGTGIVTSVPSDSPDDYAAFMDLMKPAKRDHYGIKAEWVEPFKLIPIIDVEIDGEMRSMAAQYMCEKLGVQSQKDTVKLQEAHDVCYKLGFDKGLMSTGPFKGMPVKDAKFAFRAVMVADGQAFVYHEPEKKVTSRTGDDCVVAGIDQWYLKYGDAAWKKQIIDHLQSDQFCTYNDRIKDSFLEAIGWLKEWACSRSFGLGTRVPWDEQFIIESLSDSTIYMAYYTVAHFLQADLNGAEATKDGIKPEDLTPEVWDFVFLTPEEGKVPKSKIPEKTLKAMRKEFRFWYPMDLRVSGKDLIQNHLTMSLYNHACVWEKEPELWPKGFFCNGWLLVNNEKMSKSKGNFFTVADIIQKYSADTVRLALANSGDTLEPANFDESVCNKALLSFPVFLENMKAIVEGKEPLREGKADLFADKWFANELNRLAAESKTLYATMYYREALRTAYFEFTGSFDQYKDVCRAGKTKPHKSLVMRYLEWQMIVLSPICPHFCEHGWSLLGKKGSVLDARYPEPTVPVDASIVSQGLHVYDKVPHDFILLQMKAAKMGTPESGVVYIAKSYPAWKVTVLKILRDIHAKGKVPLCSADLMKTDDTAKAQWKEIMAALMADASLKPFAKHLGPFAAFKRDDASVVGAGAFEAAAPFDELALLSENLEYLKDKLKVDLTLSLAEELKAPEHKEAAETAQPGKPAIHYNVAKGSAPAPKAKAGGGGKAAAPAAKEGAAAPAKPKPSGSTITDMQKLNEHLSTRSYMDGGSGPTSLDAAQMDAMPAALDAAKFPHADRWLRHISFFKPAQRSQW